MLTEQQRDDFIKEMIRSGLINLPKIARKVGLIWSEVEAELATVTEFRERANQVLQEVKHNLYEKIHTVAENGKSFNKGGTPELTYVKYIIEAINSGEILKKPDKATVTKDEDTAADVEWLKKLGLEVESKGTVTEEPKQG